jgi:hypothetical protein
MIVFVLDGGSIGRDGVGVVVGGRCVRSPGAEVATVATQDIHQARAWRGLCLRGWPGLHGPRDDEDLPAEAGPNPSVATRAHR